jgi:cellulose biosynthesis protein BcsQ
LRSKEIEARLVSDLAQTHMQRAVSLARAELAAELTDTGGRAELRWIVPTFYRDTNLGRDILESLCRAFGDKVTDAVRLTVRLGEAARAGKTIFEYDPQGNGATDYAAVAKRVNYGW